METAKVPVKGPRINPINGAAMLARVMLAPPDPKMGKRGTTVKTAWSPAKTPVSARFLVSSLK